MRSDRACLLDILDAVADIERYRTTRAGFDSDERTQVWMVSRLQIIGEAARQLSEAFRARHPEIAWRKIIGMRHHLVHGYFDIDPDVVWNSVAERIPELRTLVEGALSTDTELDMVD
jgi:uncharacterized protein with HEPN domain